MSPKSHEHKSHEPKSREHKSHEHDDTVADAGVGVFAGNFAGDGSAPANPQAQRPSSDSAVRINAGGRTGRTDGKVLTGRIMALASTH